MNSYVFQWGGSATNDNILDIDEPSAFGNTHHWDQNIPDMNWYGSLVW